MSSKVSMFAITLNKVEKEWNSDAKLVFEENAMEINDYFPSNQWISTDENCTDPSSPKVPYLILGTNGIHRF
jgi:hypothetical protein